MSEVVAEDPLRIRRESLTLREKACDTLRKAIFDQRFPPGTRLVERDLCEKLGVSRTSVREALRHLESEHLIEMVPHKGPVVATLSHQEIVEIYDVRCLLEGRACEMFAVNASDDHLRQLEAVFADLKKAVRSKDKARVLNIKVEFYRIIFDGSRSTICRKLVESLMSRIGPLRQLSLNSKDRGKVMIEEIGALVSAARRRDAAGMKLACITHINSALEVVMTQLQDNQTNDNQIVDNLV